MIDLLEILLNAGVPLKAFQSCVNTFITVLELLMLSNVTFCAPTTKKCALLRITMY